MTPTNINDIVLEQTEVDNSQLLNIKFILSNHLNTEFHNLKTLLNYLPKIDNDNQRAELMIFIQNTLSSLENSMIQLNAAVYQDVENQ